MDSQAQPRAFPRSSLVPGDSGLDLSQELREALPVHAVCLRFRPELLGVAIVELDLLLLKDLDHPDRCAAQTFS